MRSIAALLGSLTLLVLAWALWPSTGVAPGLEPGSVVPGLEEQPEEPAVLVGDGSGAASEDGQLGQGTRESALGEGFLARIEIVRPRHTEERPVDTAEVAARRLEDQELLRWNVVDGVWTERLPEGSYRLLLVKVQGEMVEVASQDVGVLSSASPTARLVLEPEPGFLLHALDARTGAHLEEVWVWDRHAEAHYGSREEREALERTRMGDTLREQPAYDERDSLWFPQLVGARHGMSWEPLGHGASPLWVEGEPGESLVVGSPERAFGAPVEVQGGPDDFWPVRVVELGTAGAIDVVVEGTVETGLAGVQLEGWELLGDCEPPGGTRRLRLEGIAPGRYELVVRARQGDVQAFDGEILVIHQHRGSMGVSQPVEVVAGRRTQVVVDWNSYQASGGAARVALRFEADGQPYQTLRVTRVEDGTPAQWERYYGLPSLRSQNDPYLHELHLEDVPAGTYQLTLSPLGWRASVEVAPRALRERSFDCVAGAPMAVRVEAPEGGPAVRGWQIRWGHEGETEVAGQAQLSPDGGVIQPASYPIWVQVRGVLLPADDEGGTQPRWSDPVPVLAAPEPGHRHVVELDPGWAD